MGFFSIYQKVKPLYLESLMYYIDDFKYLKNGADCNLFLCSSVYLGNQI